MRSLDGPSHYYQMMQTGIPAVFSAFPAISPPSGYTLYPDPWSTDNSPGLVQWDDGGDGAWGSFNPAGNSPGTGLSPYVDGVGWTTTYTPPLNPGMVFLTANYLGTFDFGPGSGTIPVGIFATSGQPTATSITPNPSYVTVGDSIPLTATFYPPRSSGSPPAGGFVFWNDNAAGGNFNASGWGSGITALSPSGVHGKSNSCQITYTAPPTPGPVTISAAFTGDNLFVPHSSSSASATVNVLSLYKYIPSWPILPIWSL